MSPDRRRPDTQLFPLGAEITLQRCDHETLNWQQSLPAPCCHGNHSSAALWTKNKILSLIVVYWFGIFLVSLSSLKPDEELCFDL